jgi:glycosyltransferase involved in cell wall biosynthesis
MGPEASVSVVIPTRNRGALLVEAVESALGANALEIIVADGGSDDGSLETVAALDARVILVRGAYRNAAATRNAGAAAATGEYLAFLDSDDVMLPEKISCLGRRLDAERDIGLVHGALVVMDADGADDAVATASHDAALLDAARLGTRYSDLAAVCVMFTSATLIRRSAFEDVGGYDEELEAYEDWDFYLRLALRHRLAYERCVAARYRVWPGNVGWDRTAEWTVKVAEKHLAALPAELSPAARRDARYAFLRRMTQSHHILLDRPATRRSAVRAARVDARRAFSDPGVRGPALRSFLPRAFLESRRPSRPGS